MADDKKKIEVKADDKPEKESTAKTDTSNVTDNEQVLEAPTSEEVRAEDPTVQSEEDKESIQPADELPLDQQALGEAPERSKPRGQDPVKYGRAFGQKRHEADQEAIDNDQEEGTTDPIAEGQRTAKRNLAVEKRVQKEHNNAKAIKDKEK